MPTSSPFVRRRWTEQDARLVLAALERSGKALRVFAEERSLDPQRLYAWRRRVARGDRTTFRELIVRPTPTTSAGGAQGSPFEIVLASGIVVRVPPSFDATALAGLLDVVTQARAC